MNYIGYVDGKTTYIYNHVNIILEYHEVDGASYYDGPGYRWDIKSCRNLTTTWV